MPRFASTVVGVTLLLIALLLADAIASDHPEAPAESPSAEGERLRSAPIRYEVVPADGP